MVANSHETPYVVLHLGATFRVSLESGSPIVSLCQLVVSLVLQSITDSCSG